MKKLFITMLVIFSTITLLTNEAFANDKKEEISTKQYIKTLKTNLKKNKFEELEEHAIINPIKTRKINKVGLNYAYIEPTIKNIEHNRDKTIKLISFLNSYITDDEEINAVSKDMILVLTDMNENLNACYLEMNNQLSLDISDCKKMDNLNGPSSYLRTENKLYAYDYLNRFNNRLDKVEKMYYQIKKLS